MARTTKFSPAVADKGYTPIPGWDGAKLVRQDDDVAWVQEARLAAVKASDLVPTRHVTEFAADDSSQLGFSARRVAAMCVVG